MLTKSFRSWVCLASFAILGLNAAEPAPAALPPPEMRGGKPLMEALQARRSTREFDLRALPTQELSNLLWAAFGVNRIETKGRTAPSTFNAQSVDLYVFTRAGVTRYVAESHQLISVGGGDFRGLTGGQDFTKQAPVSVVFVADYRKLGKASENDRRFYAAVDTGLISENIYLYCASAGLGTVVHALNESQELRRALQLDPEQRVILAQAIGYAKE